MSVQQIFGHSKLRSCAALFFCLLYFPLSLFRVSSLLCKKSNKFQKNIFLLYEGGFGHTIMQVEVFLYYFDPRAFNIILATPGRHNLQAAILFENNYHVISRGILGKQASRCDAFFLWRTDRLIFLIFRMLARFFSLNVHDTESLVRFANEKGYRYLGRHKSIERLWFESKRSLCEIVPKEDLSVDKRPTNYLFVNSFGVNFVEFIADRKPVAFYLRRKGFIDNPDDFLRSGKSLQNYEVIFDNLIQLGYTVLVYGDISDDGHEWAKSKIGGLFTHKTSHFRKDVWDLLCGMHAQFVIGNNGGGLTIPVRFNKNILILDSWQFHTTVPYSLNSFKSLMVNGSRISPMEYFLLSPDGPKEESGFRAVPNCPQFDLAVLREFLMCIKSWPQNERIYDKLSPKSAFNYAPGAFISKCYLEREGLNLVL